MHWAIVSELYDGCKEIDICVEYDCSMGVGQGYVMSQLYLPYFQRGNECLPRPPRLKSAAEVQ